MANETTGLLGRKLGMTQIFDGEGVVIPVTVIVVPTNHVLAVKSASGADGYNAVKLGIDELRASRTTTPIKGEYASVGVSPRRRVREIRMSAAEAGKFQVGQSIALDSMFQEGAIVDVCGTSKGSGFSGVMKKHHFKGFIRSHGSHEYFRHGGSIGTRLTPGMTLKGKKMPGQLGNAKITVQNQRLVRVDAERGLLFVRGGVPGPNGGYVTVRAAVKKQRS